ncbi:hypothetical protein [Aneurinibacillus tyrosinisolvens]|uniref:hypothetical protein n=1 Tax=Aneurinibacillus tyrosinisolvens TaxID=1443435 RepID=UPI00063F019E|nr:hypothetical protein [Aneurinibacillus tyrosinisolvens]
MKNEQQKPIYYDGSGPLMIPKRFTQAVTKPDTRIQQNGPLYSASNKGHNIENKQPKPPYYDGSGSLK